MRILPASTRNHNRLRVADKASKRLEVTTSSMNVCRCTPPYSLAVLLAAHCSPRAPSIQAFCTAHTPSTRSISDDSTAILPVLAVRKVLATVLILRVHCVWCLPCNGDAVGMYMTCIFIWDKTQATRCCFYSDATADMWSCCCAVDAAETYHISADNIIPKRPR